MLAGVALPVLTIKLVALRFNVGLDEAFGAFAPLSSQTETLLFRAVSAAKSQ